ncbi:DUF302 domain-containing protein [Antrihabitans sp. YC2-6]|uniref:DUF302 domain-containing protein n=1 Tax=Antrihabitans sp. YC2-6 TaxID=2799498 RepID=UPI0018F38C03|nr:DUF302 domain-containing protein [Antrihabitans sp. YC2-6]MBJ8347053.1 DUF302 domain-containing protein [Antrihabitans sp. YC2-6]
MNIALSTTLENTDFDTAVAETKAALSKQGFGVLTEIDMQATLKAKIGVDMERYLILGACNPALAHRAVGVLPQIGLLLPCNVVVRADTTVPESNSVIVEAMNPQIMVEVTGEPELAAVASAATDKLRAAIDALGGRTIVRQ